MAAALVDIIAEMERLSSKSSQSRSHSNRSCFRSASKSKQSHFSKEIRGRGLSDSAEMEDTLVVPSIDISSSTGIREGHDTALVA